MNESLVRGSIDEVFVSDGLERFRESRVPEIIAAGTSLEISGWATIGEEARSAARFEVYVAGKRIDNAVYRIARPDVAAHLASAAATDCGFAVTIDPEAAALPYEPCEVRIVLDGSHEVFRFEVRRLAEDVAPKRYTYEVKDLYAEGGAITHERRVERGFVAVVRGRLRDGRGAGIPSDSFCVVNRTAAYPVLLQGAATTDTIEFLACIPTESLPIGTASLRFATRGRAHDPREWSEPHAFRVAPVCVHEMQAPVRRVAAPGAFDRGESETPDGVRHASRGEIVDVRGWIFDSIDSCAVRAAYVVFADGQQFAMDTGAARMDVVRALDNPYALFAGFAGSISTASFPPGLHTGRLCAVSVTGSTLFVSDAVVTLRIED